jgi:hypothetical protein
LVDVPAPADHDPEGDDVQNARGRAQAARYIPKERRELSTWQHVEKTLRECAAVEDTVNISVALRLVLQAERVPYR